MELNLIALAIPAFFVFIGGELLVAWLKGRRVMRTADAVSNLSCGIANQVLSVPVGAANLLAYTWLWDRFRLVDGAASDVWVWVVAFVGVDFLYYWWHRGSHELNVMWAAHVVHHQSEDYNLAVALRQALFTPLTSFVVYFPLALLGVPPVVQATMVALSTLYQFWIHTELVGTLGPLEWVLNTPSHHRVHHAIQPQYRDRNHGAVLIVWDRLFGTFEPEVEPCVYGTVKPLHSFNPLWANLAPPLALLRDSLTAPRWSDRLSLWLRKPEYVPAGVAAPVVPAVEGREKYDVAPTAGIVAWVALQFIGAAAAIFVLLQWGTAWPVPVQAGVGLLCLWTVADLGGLLEGRRWAWPSEGLRLLAAAGMLALVVGS